LYSPGGSAVMTYKPASLVCLLVATVVATFVATTEAPGTTAPVGSVMIPWMDPPPPVWAITLVPTQKQNRNTASMALVAFIVFSFSDRGNRLTKILCEFSFLQASN
jgi:hypothetical protein